MSLFRRAVITLTVLSILVASALLVAAREQDTQMATLPATLEDLSNPAKALTAAQLEEIASSGLRHATASVRQRALQGVAQRLQLAQFQGGPNMELTTSEARVGFEAVRPLIQNALSDPDEQVRHTAVVAIGAMGVSGSARAPSLDRRTLELFVFGLSNEPSAMVRAEMMKIVALTPAADPLRQEVLTAGLESGAPAVVAFALRGVGDDRLASDHTVGSALPSPSKSAGIGRAAA